MLIAQLLINQITDFVMYIRTCTRGGKYSGPWDQWSQKIFYVGRKKKGSGEERKREGKIENERKDERKKMNERKKLKQ